jgi:hypothetical protein
MRRDATPPTVTCAQLEEIAAVSQCVPEKLPEIHR